MLPEHCVWPAAHTPVHLPAAQVWLTQHSVPHAMPPSQVNGPPSMGGPTEESMLAASAAATSAEASTGEPVSIAV
jgi:hypothetical protein